MNQIVTDISSSRPQQPVLARGCSARQAIATHFRDIFVQGDSTMSQLVLEGPVRSTKADDPDYTELIEMFVDETAVRASQMQTLFSRGDVDQLQRMAHQLRGAGCGYGFDHLTPLAGRLEKACEQGDPADVAGALHDVVAYLGRMSC